nr:MAG: hypothetical protein [Inoviridae sp.]
MVAYYPCFGCAYSLSFDRYFYYGGGSKCDSFPFVNLKHFPLPFLRLSLWFCLPMLMNLLLPLSLTIFLMLSILAVVGFVALLSVLVMLSCISLCPPLVLGVLHLLTIFVISILPPSLVLCMILPAGNIMFLALATLSHGIALLILPDISIMICL